jgi:hypothetical protein
MPKSGLFGYLLRYLARQTLRATPKLPLTVYSFHYKGHRWGVTVARADALRH